MPEIRDVFIVIFSVGVAVFGYELMWNQTLGFAPDEQRDVRETW
jgi:hypothetical protein